MLEKENLTPFQIQLLLYYLTAEPSKRTVTDSARSLNVSKWVVTRTLDTLEKLNIVERLENRKTVLTVPGVKLAEKYQKQRKVLEKYMQYQDIPPAQIKENALRALAARFLMNLWIGWLNRKAGCISKKYLPDAETSMAGIFVITSVMAVTIFRSLFTGNKSKITITFPWQTVVLKIRVKSS